MEAKLCAKARAAREAPTDLEAELRAEDNLHQAIYETAARRISAMLGDQDHYMNEKCEKVETTYKVKPDKPKGRLEVFRQLVQRVPGPGQREWQLHRQGVRCCLGGKRIKSCSTHADVSSKQDALCPGRATKTLEQLMNELMVEYRVGLEALASW